MDVTGWQEGHPVLSQALAVSEVIGRDYRPSVLRNRREDCTIPQGPRTKPRRVLSVAPPWPMRTCLAEEVPGGLDAQGEPPSLPP